METLKIRKGFEKVKIEFFRNEDMALIQYAPNPKRPLRDEFIGEYLVAHVDGDTSEIVSVTITNMTAFLEKTAYYKQKAKENVEQIVKNTRKLIRILPHEIIYQIRICA